MKIGQRVRLVSLPPESEMAELLMAPLKWIGHEGVIRRIEPGPKGEVAIVTLDCGELWANEKMLKFICPFFGCGGELIHLRDLTGGALRNGKYEVWVHKATGLVECAPRRDDEAAMVIQVGEVRDYATERPAVRPVDEEAGSVGGDHRRGDQPVTVDNATIKKLAEDAAQAAASELFGFMDVKFLRGKTYANSPEQTVAICIEQAFLAAWGREVKRSNAKLVKRLKDGREKTGRYAGVRPYGIDLIEMSVISQMKKLRAAGEKWSQIASALNILGVPTRNGKTWHGSTVAKIVQRAK